MGQVKDNLQQRSKNALSELGEKIFLDRYAVKDMKRETLATGDIAIVLVNPKTGQREIGTIESIDRAANKVQIRLRDGELTERAIEHVDKPLETVPEQMFDRIAEHIASVENVPATQKQWQDNFRKLIDDWRFVPAGRIYTGAGTGQNLTFYNCYVVPSPHDSRHGIFDTLGQMAEIMSRGGGVGINVSSLRPRYAYVRGVNGRSSGSVSWASLYSFVTGLIEQGGSRRGALMLILACWHPDIMDFINSKREAGKITNANISVAVTDDFMEAVKKDADWDLVFPDPSDPRYQTEWNGDLKKWRESGGKMVKHKTVKAREIWHQIISSAWASAEPGVYFIDRASHYSNSWYFAPLPCTNPCGEQPLPAWGVCNLGHVNLAKHVDVAKKEVMWDRLRETISWAVRFQDNVIDATPYFFEENKKQQLSERRVGMGTIGLAEMLIYLGIRYGSDESVEFIDKLYKFIAVSAYETSVEIAKEKGAFPRFDAEKFLQSGFMKQMPEDLREKIRKHGIRNVTILTQAPTGTVGTMVGTSTGIEPFYSWTYYRKSRLGVHQEHIKIAKDWLDAHPGEELPPYYANAMDLDPEAHVKVMAAVQRWTDAAISKTTNAPSHYTVEDTEKLYELMYDLGAKGGTIYRDGSRDEQVLATDSKHLGKDVAEQLAEKAAKQAKNGASAQDIAAVIEQAVEKKVAQASHAQAPTTTDAAGYGIVEPRDRPETLVGTTYRVKTPYGHLYITINDLPGDGIFEVFATLGKAGGFFHSQVEAICRLISLNLRAGVKQEEVIKQLKGIRGPDPMWNNGKPMFSIADAVAQTMERHTAVKEVQKGKIELPLEKTRIEATKAEALPNLMTAKERDAVTVDGKKIDTKTSIANFGSSPICPDCGGSLVMAEGCMNCMSCGYSKCG